MPVLFSFIFGKVGTLIPGMQKQKKSVPKIPVPEMVWMRDKFGILSII
jgi:hypothetical protein